MSKKIIYALLIGIFLLSCQKKNKHHAEAKKIITEWVGKTIRFSSNISLTVYGKDTMLPNFFDTPYRVLLYVDSSGCTSCKLRLYEWQHLIADTDTTMNEKVSFLFFFQPKNKDELIYKFKRDRFDYPVYIDKQNEINRLNHFPDNAQYQCFLLVNKNKVISVGNPATNPKIWDLYKQIILGKIKNNNSLNTQVEMIDSQILLNNLKSNENQKLTFRLKNIGEIPLSISDVKSSCGCTNASWEKKPTESQKTTEIKVDLKIEQKGYFEKTLTVYCNADNSPITLKIKGNTK